MSDMWGVRHVGWVSDMLSRGVRHVGCQTCLHGGV